MIRNILLLIIFIVGTLAVGVARTVQAELNAGAWPSILAAGAFCGVFWFVYSKNMEDGDDK